MTNDKMAIINDEKTIAQDIAKVSIKIPPFWEDDPAMWFAQIEMQFIMNGVSQDTTKFYYIASTLNQKQATEVRDIILNPPESNKYEKLKTELIRRLSSSEEQKLKQLLQREEIGDRTASQFLRYIRSLANDKLPESLLKTLWISRLPTNTQGILATIGEKSLDDMAVIADKILETHQSGQYVAVASTSSEKHIKSLEKEIDDLRIEIRSLIRQRSNTHERFRSKSRNRNDPKLCYYHNRFGSKARKCRQPCSYNSENPNENQ